MKKSTTAWKPATFELVFVKENLSTTRGPSSTEFSVRRSLIIKRKNVSHQYHCVIRVRRFQSRSERINGFDSILLRLQTVRSRDVEVPPNNKWADVKTVIAKNHKMKGAQATTFANARPIEVPQNLQPFGAKADIWAKKLHRQVLEKRSKDLRASICEEKPCLENLAISKIANELFRLQRNVKPWTGVDRTPLRIVPEHDQI